MLGSENSIYVKVIGVDLAVCGVADRDKLGLFIRYMGPWRPYPSTKLTASADLVHMYEKRAVTNDKQFLSNKHVWST